MEVPVASLWLPILLSAVAVFVVSSILHMVLPLHRNDYRQLSNESEAMATLRKGSVSQSRVAPPPGPAELALLSELRRGG